MSGTFPNYQSNPGAAIPVWIVQPGAAPGLDYLGYAQDTDLAAASGLPSVPAGATLALIEPESGNVRWRADGTDPTGDVGTPLWGTAQLQWAGDMTAIKFINMTGSTAKLNVTYYGTAP